MRVFQRFLSAAITCGVLLLWPLAAAAEQPVPAPSGSEWAPPLPPPLSVVRGFDPPAVRWGSGHRGVDLAAPAGTAVRAAGAGQVSFAGLLAGRGIVVVVHGALRTTYEPVAASVHVGATVAAGESIGLLRAGHDPARPSAGILHWGLLRGDAYLDPMSLLALPRPVRLLPRWGFEPAGAGAAAVARQTVGTGTATGAGQTNTAGHRFARSGAVALSVAAGAGVATWSLRARPP